MATTHSSANIFETFIQFSRDDNRPCCCLTQGDEFLTSMASTHSSAKMFETFEQAQNAIELVTTAYRAYMDKLYEVYPQVSTNWATPPPHQTPYPSSIHQRSATCPLDRFMQPV